MPGLRLSVIAGANEDMVSLEYMEEYGEALASKLRGMYAFVIYDMKEKLLFGMLPKVKRPG